MRNAYKIALKRAYTWRGMRMTEDKRYTTIP